MSGRREAVIAGGGTGGHVVPSLQIARALVEQGYEASSIELIGSRRGQEATVWPPLQFSYTLLSGRGIRRSLSPGALWANAGAVLGLLWACLRALGSFVVHRPKVVVVVGGYASFAAGLAAVLTRVPMILVNTDAVPGAVNAVLGRFATVNAVAFPGTDLPRSEVTGTPVRPELGHLDRTPAGRQAAREELGLPADRPTVAAFGGSLGARRINAAVAELAQKWSADQRTIYQVAGRRDYDQFARPDALISDHHTEVTQSTQAHPDEATGLFYTVVPFENRMPVLYRAADVCVCRAGAMTVAELLLTGMPSVLVPLPGAPKDHQTRNAQVLVEAGAAILVPDGQCDSARLDAELSALLADPARLAAMSEAARALGRGDAAVRVAELVRDHAR